MTVPIAIAPDNPYIIGRPIRRSDNFFGRDSLFAFLHDTLKHGSRVVLLHGQRRIGKSSILAQVPHRVRLPGLVFVSLSLEGKSRKPLATVLHELARDICDELECARLPVPAVEVLQDCPQAFAQRFIPAVLEVLDGSKDTSDTATPPPELVFLLDEFDVLAGDEAHPDAAAHHFFPYLYRLLHQCDRLRAIAVIGRQLDDLPNLLSLFNAAPHREIGLLEAAETRQLVVEPATASLHYEEGAIAAIFELTAGHPYLTQVVCFALFARLREGLRDETLPWTVTAADVAAIGDRAMELGAAGLTWFRDGLPIPERVVFSAIAHRSCQVPSAAPEAAIAEDGTLTSVTPAFVRVLSDMLQGAQTQLAQRFQAQAARLYLYDGDSLWTMDETGAEHRCSARTGRLGEAVTTGRVVEGEVAGAARRVVPVLDEAARVLAVVEFAEPSRRETSDAALMRRLLPFLRSLLPSFQQFHAAIAHQQQVDRALETMQAIVPQDASRDAAIALLADRGVVVVEALTDAPRRLRDWDYVRGTRVTVELVRRWLLKNYPLQRELFELERLDAAAIAHYERGRTLHANDDESGAIAAYTRCLHRNPNHFRALFELAQLYFNTEQLDRAVSAFRRATQVDRLRNEADYVRSLVAYGERLWQIGDVVAARSQFEEALRVQPDSMAAREGQQRCLAVSSYSDVEPARAKVRPAIDFGTDTNSLAWLRVSKIPPIRAAAAASDRLLKAIERTSELHEEDKAEARSQLIQLAMALLDPQEPTVQKRAKTALKILKGTMMDLSPRSPLYRAFNEELAIVTEPLPDLSTSGGSAGS